ncbi:MAG: AsmA-like C-terminal region-containing protein [Bacteroidota bacterium]
MALTKTAKIWLYIIGIPVGLIIIAVIGAKLYFTDARLRALIIPKVEEATSRTVTVGDASLSVFPSIGLSLDNLVISNRLGTHFDRPEMVALDHLQLNVNLLALFRNEIDVTSITIDHPVIYLEIQPDGLKNYSDKTAANEAPSTTTAQAGGTGALLLQNLEITNGEILQVDKKFDARMAISGLHLQARGGMGRGANTLQLTFETTVDKFSYGSLASNFLEDLPITARGALSLDQSKQSLSIDSVGVRLKDLPLSVHGNVTDLNTVPYLDLLVDAPNANMTALLSLVPPEMLKAAKGINSSGSIDLSVIIKGVSSDKMNPGVRGRFALSNGKVQYASLPKSITNISVEGMFEKPAAEIGAKGIGTFNIDKLSASLGDNLITGKLDMTNFSDPVIAASMNGAVNLSDVKSYYPLEEGTEVSGMLKSNVSIEGKVKVPTSIKASGSLEFQDVSYKSAASPKPLQHLNGVINFNNQVIQSKQLSMNIGESDLNLAFTLNNYLALVMKEAGQAGKPNAMITLNSKQLRTADLVSEKKPDTSRVKTKTASDQTGVLPGFDLSANLSIGKLAMEKFDFTNVHGTLSASQGIVTLQNFSFNAFDGNIISKGTLDLRDAKKKPFNFDLNIVGVDGNTMLSKFSSFGKNIFGKFTMNTKMKGDLDDTLGLVRQTLAGDGTVQVNDGKLVGFALTNKLADYTGLSEFRQIDFKNWSNAFTIADGKMNLKNLAVHSPSADFTVNGNQGLDGNMDFMLNAKLNQAVSSRINLQGVGAELLQFFKDKDGRVNLNFAVTGMVDSPALRLDTQAQQDMAKKALENKVGDDLKKKAEDALKNLFKKP